MTLRIGIGLVVKGGKEWIDNWIICADAIGDIIIVVDNGADKEVRDILINHPKVKRYHIQKGLERNQSRDYQNVLEMARKENCHWIWNIDIDEYVPTFDTNVFRFSLLNEIRDSVGFPLLEMRGDREHYVMVKDPNGQLKDGRLVHKCYRILSHFEFNKKDIHGMSIPHNCSKVKAFLSIPIHHYGHMTKELRDEKRKRMGFDKDEDELIQTWMNENEDEITIKSWSDFRKKYPKQVCYINPPQ